MYRSAGSLWYWFFHSMWFETGSQLHSSLPFCVSPLSTFHAFLSVTYVICHVSLPECLWWFSCLCLVGVLGLQTCSVHMAFIEFQGFKIGVHFHHCTASAFPTEMSLQLHFFLQLNRVYWCWRLVCSDFLEVNMYIHFYIVTLWTSILKSSVTFWGSGGTRVHHSHRHFYSSCPIIVSIVTC